MLLGHVGYVYSLVPRPLPRDQYVTRKKVERLTLKMWVWPGDNNNYADLWVGQVNTITKHSLTTPVKLGYDFVTVLLYSTLRTCVGGSRM